jgi:hypothetical protein
MSVEWHLLPTNTRTKRPGGKWKRLFSGVGRLRVTSFLRTALLDCIVAGHLSPRCPEKRRRPDLNSTIPPPRPGVNIIRPSSGGLSDSYLPQLPSLPPVSYLTRTRIAVGEGRWGADPEIRPPNRERGPPSHVRKHPLLGPTVDLFRDLAPPARALKGASQVIEDCLWGDLQPVVNPHFDVKHRWRRVELYRRGSRPVTIGSLTHGDL